MIPVIRVFCPGSGIYPGHHLHRTSSLPPFTIASSAAHQLAQTLSRAAKLRGVQIDVFKYGRGIIKTTPASACSSCFWWKFPIIPYKWLRKNLCRSTEMIFKQFSLQSQAPRIDDRWSVLVSHYSVSKFPRRFSLQRMTMDESQKWEELDMNYNQWSVWIKPGIQFSQSRYSLKIISGSRRNRCHQRGLLLRKT